MPNEKREIEQSVIRHLDELESNLHELVRRLEERADPELVAQLRRKRLRVVSGGAEGDSG